VVTQAADKGIPVRLGEAVSMNVKMSGTLNSPEVKTDMDAVVDNAASDLKKEINEFVNAKLDSAKEQLHNPSAASKKQIFVQTANKTKPVAKAKKNAKTVKKKTIHPKGKKKPVHQKSKKKKKPSGSYTSIPAVIPSLQDQG
jgi:hypothetical protein